MARRKRPLAKVYHYDEAQYWTKHEGWGLHQAMAAVGKRATVTGTRDFYKGAMVFPALNFGEASNQLWFGQGDLRYFDVRAFTLLPDPVGGIILTPYPDITQEIDLTYWEPTDPTHFLAPYWSDQGTWWRWPYIQHTTALWPGATGAATNIIGSFIGLKSRFVMPRRPIIHLALSRPNKPVYRDENGNDVPYPSEIYGGLGNKITFCETASPYSEAFQLLIAYDGIRMLWRNAWYTGDRWVELRTSRRGAARGMNFDQQSLQFKGSETSTDVPRDIWIICEPEGVLVVIGHLIGGESVFFELPVNVDEANVENPLGRRPSMFEGKVTIEGNMGHWGFVWMPTRMPSTMVGAPPDGGDPFERAVRLRGQMIGTDHDIYDGIGSGWEAPGPWYVGCLDNDWAPYEGTFGTSGIIPRNITYSNRSGVSETRVPQGMRGMEWAAGFVPYDHHFSFETDRFPPYRNQMRAKDQILSDQARTIVHYVSPELRAMSWAKDSIVGYEGVSQTQVPEARLYRVSRSVAEHDGINQATVSLEDNITTEGPTRRDQIGDAFRVQTGHRMSDDTDDVEFDLMGDLRSVEGLIQGSESGVKVDVFMNIASAIQRLAEGKWGPDTPAMDGWAVKDAVQYTLNQAGVPDVWYTCGDSVFHGIEDTGQVLSRGTPEQPHWKPAEGTLYLEHLRELCLFDFRADLRVTVRDQAGVYTWYFTKCCYYCGLKRNTHTLNPTPIVGHTHWYGEYRAASCFAADIARSGDAINGVDFWIVEDINDWANIPGATSIDDVIMLSEANTVRWERKVPAAIASDAFANHVTVRGAVPGGGSADEMLRSEMTDWHSVHPKSVGAQECNLVGKKLSAAPIERRWAGTRDASANLAFCYLGRMCGNPLFVEVSGPFRPGLQKSHVIAFYGTRAFADQQLHGKRFRVLGASGQVMGGRWASDRIVARYCGQATFP